MPAAADQADELTAGQVEFLANLEDVHRAAFDNASPGKRAALLRPHEGGFDPRILEFQLRTEFRGLSKPIAPPPTVPATTAEFIERLGQPGAPRDWTCKLADELANRFGRKEDRKLFRELERIALAVWRGRLDVGHVLNAYGQAMADGIENRGGKFWAALRCLAGIDTHGLRELAEGKGVSHIAP